ncbi:hypothetical protein [Tichowtungia aerotolerans]|uniref:Uncharacterized protein n=1 Tax=Tichowtungia aerotolerans TaxID=2697043 RepID=A0A6P1M8U5_9BACT|nr:hypothetical protein [Tichowtungia aerotolerans]QHI69493.1 hypothetical protein GT409_08505 [Tichowtungia aerotolerans]
MKKTDHSIRNSVVATLIATLIIAIVKPMRNMAIVVFKWLWQIILAFKAHLGSTASVPWWLVYAVLAIIILLLSRAIRQALQSLATDVAKASPLSYTTDHFHGLVWRWRMDSDFQPYRISTFCPHCDMQLRPCSSGYGYSTQFHCDKCGFSSSNIEMETGQLEEWISREIQRKLRTNEWKQELPNQ